MRDLPFKINYRGYKEIPGLVQRSSISPHLSLHLLGPPQLYLDLIPIISERRKVVALVAYPAIEQGRRTRESLSALFWPDYEQSKAYSNLRHTLWEIQRSIGGDWLVTDRETVNLNEDAYIWLDVQKFQSLLTLGKETRKLPAVSPSWGMGYDYIAITLCPDSFSKTRLGSTNGCFIGPRIYASNSKVD